MSVSIPKRALIFTGGDLGPWAISLIQSEDYLIGADRGADFLVSHGYTPDLAIGDFDSVSPEQLSSIQAAAQELHAYDAADKDWTDTELALREAIRRGYREIVMVGALGTRFDHSLGNVFLLKLANELSCQLTIIDAHNEITLCTEHSQVKRNEQYPYLSLLPLTPEASGITLQGFRYPLVDASLRMGQSLGISNILEAEVGSIKLSSGMLLIIRSRD